MSEIQNKLRFIILLVLTLLMMCAASLRLMRLQIVDGGIYLQKSQSSQTAVQVINAPRGEITDYSGSYLVSNKSGFNVVIEKAFFPSDDSEINRIILTAAELLESDGVEWNDVLPISDGRVYNFSFEEDRESDIARLRKNIGVQVYATADECINAMQDLYGIDRDLDRRSVRIIAGIRYTMFVRDFSVSNKYTFAEAIPMETVVRLKELCYDLDGVDIVEEAIRVNDVGDVIPHLIGTVGPISAEEYAELKDKGYALNDSLGKSGVELAMEDTLKGRKGTRTIEIMGGTVISDNVTEPAVPGNSIKLTVDSDYQRKVQTILENHIYWLQNQTSPKAKGSGADAGAIVVLNAKTGALLAAATSPTYDLNEYIENYSLVANGENSPLTNRATSGLYRPGSTFKTITATAALNEGFIYPDSTIKCNGVYTYWEDWSPGCTGVHGNINVVTALKESCNIFFYDIGRIMGIDIIAEYASAYGLGEEMGLEIGRGVKKGYIATPETYKARQLDWQAGNVIQAAIGQADTYVTPLQMAGQALMIANRGVRYQTYMVDSVYDYNMDNLIYRTEPVVAAVIEDKTGFTYDNVINGMIQAAEFQPYTYPTIKEYYTDSYLLTDFEHKAAIKTGTPQTTKKDTGSAFIGFYPADDPEIAFSGFVEHGEYSKFMVREIIAAYYDEFYKIEPLALPKSEEQILDELAGLAAMDDDTEEYE